MKAEMKNQLKPMDDLKTGRQTYKYRSYIRASYGHTPAAGSSCRKGREEARGP